MKLPQYPCLTLDDLNIIHTRNVPLRVVARYQIGDAHDWQYMRDFIGADRLTIKDRVNAEAYAAAMYGAKDYSVWYIGDPETGEIDHMEITP